MKQILLVALIVLSSCGYVSARSWHYRIILPPGYIGWVQVIFGDTSAAPLSGGKKYLQVEVGENGIVRTSQLPVWFGSPDEFLYRTGGNGKNDKLIPVPAAYVLDEAYGGGFTVGGTPDGSPGTTSWFFFIGPSEIREKTPMADIRKEPGYGHRQLAAPKIYPKPGRMQQRTQ
jgi:hypothetical protein